MTSIQALKLPKLFMLLFAYGEASLSEDGARFPTWRADRRDE